jgi:hypothetical protein
MAAHMQQQVLDAIVSALIAANTSAGESVFLDRVDQPANASKLPAIRVEEAADGETIESWFHSRPAGTHAGRPYPLRARALGPCTAAECRAFGLEVEKALRTSEALAALRALCTDYAITRSRLEQSTEGEQTYAQRVQDWTFTYVTRRGTPDAKA